MTLTQQAIDILRRNDRGGFTVPTEGLYPYQWNWDSGFIALGIATYDPERAWQEIETLLDNQWPDGMVPSIVFHRDDPDYFPGPSIWQTQEGPLPSTGISQPPVLSIIVEQLLDQNLPIGADRLLNIFERLFSWHRWFHTARRVDRCPVVATVHPWETGRDNCPDWNLGLEGMDVDPALPPYERMDTKHIDPSQRPSTDQYDRYLTIIKYGREIGWNQGELTQSGPFLMADPNLHFILLRADKDLLKLAQRLGRTERADEIKTWVAAGEVGTNFLWDPSSRKFCARDVKTSAFSRGFTNASLLCFLADTGTPLQRQGTLENVDRIAGTVRYLLPSWDPHVEEFEAKRYWCGPVWPQMNFLASLGLAEQGHHVLADRLKADILSLIKKSGFWECFDPLTGEGCVGDNFSWTAAVWLALNGVERLEKAA